MYKLIAFATTVLFASSAWALDGYQDRRGLFGGIAVGGGMARAQGKGETAIRLGGRVGGGLSQQLTADVDFDYIIVPEFDVRIIGFDVAGNYFFTDNLFARAGAGLAILSPEIGDTQTGFGLQLGGGFEAFFTGDLAGSVAVTYEPEFLDSTVHEVFLTIGVLWY